MSEKPVSNKSVTDIMEMPLFMKNKGILVY